MPEKCVNGRCTKEGVACQVCGGELPEGRGLNKKRYCSSECRNLRNWRRIRDNNKKAATAPCAVCGSTIAQEPSSTGRTKRLCSASCKAEWKRRLNGREKKPEFVECLVCGTPIKQIENARGNPASLCSDQCRRQRARDRERSQVRINECKRCGLLFESRLKKQFCSRSCQYEGRGEIHGDTKPCERCGKPVKISCRNYRFCSRACAKDQKAYTCLNCGVGFTKKRYKSGSVSCQEKYCSRDCAFEARRLKKPCAVRPREIGGKLASWFLSWGDDYFPYVYKCCECGASLQQKKDSAKHEKCWSCRARKDRFCIDCGSPELASLSVKRCEPCREAAKAALKKRQRRQRKRRHGNSHTIRKRCRHHNAPYTPVSRKKIFDRDNWTCQLCGMRLLARYTRLPDGGVHGLSPTVDHIIPLARGPDGPGHVESNCQAACWGCNTEKGAADPDSFAAGKATDLDSKAWQKAQHQRRSTSSRCEDQRKPTTARSLAPL